MTVSRIDLIKSIKTFYEQNNTSPRTIDIPYSTTIVRKYFATWNEALIESNVPVRMEKSIELKCHQCNKSMRKSPKQIRRYATHFCSNKCSGKYNCNIKCDPEKSKERIIKYNTERKQSSVYLSKSCMVCNKTISNRRRKTCSDECLKKQRSNFGKQYGRMGGLKSVQSQQRRSKAEVLFYDLCVKYFKDTEVLSNPQMFIDKNNSLWDCDIVIPLYKICVAYNGIWHYQNLGGTHNLEQVQSRDKLKTNIIFDNQYILYVVKDISKFNTMFVCEQFHRFIFSTFINFELDALFDKF